MNWKDYRDTIGDLFNGSENTRERFRVINIRGTMKREHRVLIKFEIVFDRRLPCSRQVLQQRVDHHVADQADSFLWDSLSTKIFVSIGRRSEQQIGDLVGQQPINFFW